MPSRNALRVVLAAVALAATAAFAQSTLQPSAGGQGLDPAYAKGWLAPDFDRFGFVTPHWREPAGTLVRRSWTYRLTERGSLGLSYSNGRALDGHVSLYGRYWFSPDWAFSAESLSREPGGLMRLQDFRIGVQRSF